MQNDPYAAGLRCCVFDIETGGLSPKNCCIISASFFDMQTGSTVQFFTDAPENEKETIAATIGKLQSYDAVITYNGRSFDLPFVQARAKNAGLSMELPLLWHIDLYRWLKKYWQPASMLVSLSQKSIEEALGLAEKRTDTIGGAECIPLYTEWLLLHDTANKEAILLHNADDVRQLGAIAGGINFLPWHRIAFDEGFRCSLNGNDVLLGSSQLKQQKFSTRAKTAPGMLPAVFLTDDYRLEYEPHDGSISLTLLPEAEGALLFADLTHFPVAVSDFSPLEGFYDGFLVLARDGEVCFREYLMLAQKIISTLF